MYSILSFFRYTSPSIWSPEHQSQVLLAQRGSSAAAISLFAKSLMYEAIILKHHGSK
jgi:hypothetical protein